MISGRQRESIKLKAIVLGLAALMIAGASFAQTSGYPNRPVKMIAPFAPGGPVDAVARVLAPKLSEGLGQQFYVENHPGGSGNIGTALAAKATADGYTILVISSTLVVNPSLFAKLGFDTTSDLAPVSLVGVSPQVLLVHPSVPAASVKELVAWVKASPGQLSYAHAGLGTPGYLAGEMLKQAFGLDLVAVSFNGGGPAITSTIGGHTPVLYTSISTAAGHRRAAFVRPARRADARGSGRAWSGIRHHPRRAGAGRDTAGRHRPLASRDRQDRRAGGRAGAPFSAWIRADRQHAEGIRRSDPMGNRQMGEGHSRGQHQGAMTARNRMIFSASQDWATAFRRDRGHWYHRSCYNFDIGNVG
jgi:tripartite-type tricarboxylate transporter receptor subunit TctC